MVWQRKKPAEPGASVLSSPSTRASTSVNAEIARLRQRKLKKNVKRRQKKLLRNEMQAQEVPATELPPLNEVVHNARVRAAVLHILGVCVYVWAVVSPRHVASM